MHCSTSLVIKLLFAYVKAIVTCIFNEEELTLMVDP